MKLIKWKSLFITCAICLLPILPGVWFWEQLPEEMAIHFNINNEPDNFASKGFVVFGLPILLAFLQGVACVIHDVQMPKRGRYARPEAVTKWILPIVVVALQIITLAYGLGKPVDIRKFAALLVGLMLMVSGIFVSQLDYINNKTATGHQARKINRFVGFSMAFVGVLFVVSMFLPPVSTIVCVVLLLLNSMLTAVYSMVVLRK